VVQQYIEEESSQGEEEPSEEEEPREESSEIDYGHFIVIETTYRWYNNI